MSDTTMSCYCLCSRKTRSRDISPCCCCSRLALLLAATTNLNADCGDMITLDDGAEEDCSGPLPMGEGGAAIGLGVLMLERSLEGALPLGPGTPRSRSGKGAATEAAAAAVASASIVSRTSMMVLLDVEGSAVAVVVVEVDADEVDVVEATVDGVLEVVFGFAGAIFSGSRVDA